MSMTTKATYPIDYAIDRLKQAVALAEIEGDFRPVRLAINDLEDSIQSEFGTELLMDQVADAKLCVGFGCSL